MAEVEGRRDATLAGRQLATGDAGAENGLPIPPDRLMYLVAGTSDVEWFLASGRLAAQAIRAALDEVGRPLASLRSVLDWGCGCGRVLRHLAGTPGPEFFGCDYNPELVEWSRGAYPHARFEVNQLAPPLPFPDGSLDLVYGLSVLTHLPEEMLSAWMVELGRVLRPGGLALLTTHGSHYLDLLAPNEKEQFLAGQLVVRLGEQAGTNGCVTFCSERYVRQQLAAANGFEVLLFEPAGALGNPFQDMYLLQRAASSPPRPPSPAPSRARRLRVIAGRLRARSLRQLKRSLSWAVAEAGGKHGVPPAHLRMKVHGSLDIPSYLAVGEACAASLSAALTRVGGDARDARVVLDFGCGAGRTLVPWSRHAPNARLFGTDIDADAIRWCQRNLTVASFAVNEPEPPLPYAAETFDLIYAVSVFTHLDEPMQLRWLRELHRVAKPGATLLLSVHGPSLVHLLPEDGRQEFARRGFAYTRSDIWSEYFPDFYHTAVHGPEYVEAVWGEYFSVLAHLERGLADHQDLVVLRRGEDSGMGRTRAPRRRVEPVPADLQLPDASQRVAAAGHIERFQWPGGGAPLTTSGWLVVPDQEVTAIEVRVNGRPLAAARAERPDVQAALPRLDGARDSGFSFTGAVPPASPEGWTLVEVIARTREGAGGAIEMLYHPRAPAALPLPPPELSRRVVNTDDPEFYRIGALRSFTAFLSAIRRHADVPESSLRLLDWGAGCGRLTAAFARLASFAEIQACDIDPAGTSWAEGQLGGEATFRVTNPHPPTPFAEGAFDVVVAYSVMTHLDRETQSEWLHEVRRLLRPGGLFLASVHGEFAARAVFDADSRAQLLRDGIHDSRLDPALDGIAPSGYYRGTFQTRAYTEQEWGRVFEILEYDERGMNNWQDLVVMRVPGPTGADAVPARGAADAAPPAGSPEELVAAHWGKLAREAPAVSSWSESPLVIEHLQRSISGDPARGWVEYGCAKYLLPKGGVERGLSLGCGSGALEREVRALGACRVMDAYDLAPLAIEEAVRAAAREGVTGIHYEVADLNRLTLPENHYDVVFASASVHHVTNLEDLFAGVRRSLRPGGHFVMLEYVGPSQFQLGEPALRIANELLALLPRELRERGSQPGSYVERIESPTLAHMNAVDPSEAIRSAEILPLLARDFEIVEKRDFGGTINHLLLQDIVQNFEDGSAERAALLKQLLYFEMLLIEQGVLDSDFTFIVARPAPGAR